MFAEIAAIMWKEWRQLLQRTGGNLLVFTIRIVLSFSFIALIIPLEVNDGAIVDYSWNLVWITMPLAVVFGLVGFSFAGERETHTLPTLLASPLSDRALVLGKVAFPVTYAVFSSLIISLCLLVKANILNGNNGLILYAPESFYSGIITSFLLATFIATLGVYRSACAPTIRQAQTSLLLTVAIAVFLPLILFVATGFLLPQNIKQNLITSLESLNSFNMTAISLLALACVDLIAIFLVMKWFDRDRLLTVN